MRTLGYEENGASMRTESFLLNDVCAEKLPAPVGTAICYLLAMSNKIQSPSIGAKSSVSDSGMVTYLLMKGNFPALAELNKEFRENSIRTWKVEGDYNGTLITVRGETDSAAIQISYEGDTPMKPELISLLVHIEVLSWFACNATHEVPHLCKRTYPSKEITYTTV